MMTIVFCKRGKPYHHFTPDERSDPAGLADFLAGDDENFAGESVLSCRASGNEASA